jgi:hypothetical protein
VFKTASSREIPRAKQTLRDDSLECFPLWSSQAEEGPARFSSAGNVVSPKKTRFWFLGCKTGVEGSLCLPLAA